MISITLEINEIGNRKATEKNHENKTWSFEKINSVSKLLVKWPEKNKWKKTQITKIRNERGNITTDLKKFKKIIREYWEHMLTNEITLKNGKILRKTQTTKTDLRRNRNSKQTYNIKEAALITLKLPTKKNLDTDGFTGEFYWRLFFLINTNFS